MPDLRPLAVLPYPLTLEQDSLVRSAKAALDVDFRVTIVEAVPGGPTRVLAFGEPGFLCDHARLAANPALESVTAALPVVLDESVDDPRLTTILDQLRAIFGPGVREIFDRDLSELVDPVGVRFVDERKYDPND